MFEKKPRSVIMKVSPELRQRIEEYARQQSQLRNCNIKLTEASRMFAQNAVTNDDKLKDAMKRMGKNWKFRL